jgi:glycosyltransferase involved in cell wall biosynthesis
MRLLKPVQFYFPFQDRGGPVFKIRALARSLARSGHEITVVTADLGLEKNNFFGMPFEACKWGWKTTLDGVEIIYLSTFAQYRALTFNKGLWNYAHDCVQQFDLVHFYGLYDLLGPTLSYFCRRSGIPYLVEPMGMYRPIDRNLFVKQLWHRGFGKKYLSRASLIVATSEIERQELLQADIPDRKIVIRYNGIDDATFATQTERGTFRKQWGIPAEEPLILFLGRLIPRKNADMLIVAFAEACPIKGRLVIAGPEGVSGYVTTLKGLAARYKINSRVIFTGPLFDAHKVAVMTDANIFVLPSRYENFANAPAEAIACGVPVIVSETCGVSKLIEGRAGIVIAPQNQPLVAAIRTLLTNHTLYDDLKRGCQAVAAELNWEVLARQMEDRYNEVLRPRYRGERSKSIWSDQLKKN